MNKSLKKLINNLQTYRGLNFIAALLCFILLGIAAYMQFSLDLSPCPLCVVQRIIIFVLCVFFLIGALHKAEKFSRQLYQGMILIISLLGIGIAGRHIWLQSLPADQVPSCGPGLEYLFKELPFLDALKSLLTGSGECAQQVWSLFSFSTPQWLLGFYLIFCLIAIWQIIREN